MDKLYYSISEVSKIVDEEQHVLRYWEKEFAEIKPRKNRAGNRVYSRKDLETIQIVQHLLRNEKLNLKKAKDKLKEVLSSETPISSFYPNIASISEPLVAQSEEIDANKIVDVLESSKQKSNISLEELKNLKSLLVDIKGLIANA